MSFCPSEIDGLCVHHLFERQALQTPDAIAVEFEGVQLSYQQLNLCADQVAAYLQFCRVEPEAPIGILMERSLDWVIAVLGVLKAGATYVPLDSSYPRERIEFMVQDAQIRWVLTQTTCRQDVQLSEVTRICSDEWEQLEEEFATVRNTSDQLAYVIYTSGSTGRPKGVAMPHRPLVNLIEWQRSRSQAITRRTLQFAPMSFDVSFQELFVTLAEGGTLVLIPEEMRQDFRVLLDKLENLSIERLFLPFVALQQLATQAVVTGKTLLQLREVITAGEALRITSDIREWFSQLPNCTLYNQYGPTETHVVTEFRLAGLPQQWPLLPSIGHPIARSMVFLLDEQLQQVPVGAVGELCVGGVSLARGYLNREELTAERFIYSPQIPQRLYRTGDLARQQPDGTFEYLGRQDDQIKVRGYRVEPGEVEAALESHPLVQQGVIVQFAQAEAKQLVAYVVLSEHEQSADPLELKQFLQQRLPAYMVPDLIQILESLPLTPSGKVNRRCLPEPVVERQARLDDKPWTATQQQLVTLWQHCLNLQHVGIDENFFDLGGNSLKMIQILLAVERQFGVPISSLVFLQSPTIAELAKSIESTQPPLPDASDALEVYDNLTLDPTISLKRNLRTWQETGIFITGATGFLGAFLLHELLEQTKAPVYCLVRASSVTSAYQRICSNLNLYGLWRPYMVDRIVPVVGDLSQPLLGLSEAEFADLADRIDIIYHNGSQVNFIYPYSALKPTNVLGTQEIIRLAMQSQLKPIHFVSSVDALISTTPDDQGVIAERPAERVKIAFGYAQSKWASEYLLLMARDRGCPTFIYRPSWIEGHSQMKIAKSSGFLSSLFQSCVQGGIAPDWDLTLNIVPVDYVSRSVVALSRQQTEPEAIFHLTNPAGSIRWNRIVDWFMQTGYLMHRLPYSQWIVELRRSIQESPEHPLYPFWSLLSAQSSDQQWLPQLYFPERTIGCLRALAGVTSSGINCPPIDENWLWQCLPSMVQHDLAVAEQQCR